MTTSKVTTRPVIKTTTKFELELTKEDILHLLSIPSIQKLFEIEEGSLPKNTKVVIHGDAEEYDGDSAVDGSVYITWEE